METASADPTTNTVDLQTIESEVPHTPARADFSEVTDLTDIEHTILSNAESSLHDGLRILKWWQKADAEASIAETFPMMREPALPVDPIGVFDAYATGTNSYGFFDHVPLNEGRLPVLGVVQDMFYDRFKAAPAQTAEAAEAMRKQVKDYMLEYFMRSCSTRLETMYANPGQKTSTSPYNLCVNPEPAKNGFDYTQLFYKESATNKVRRFPAEDARKIIRLDRIGKELAWILIKIDIHNFGLSTQVGSYEGPTIYAPVGEQVYVIIHPDLIANRENPSPDVLGEYGYGYTFIGNPRVHNIWGYGPEKLTQAFEFLHFRVKKNGEVWVKMGFAANMPDRIVLDLNPAELGVIIGNTISGKNLGTKLFQPFLDLYNNSVFCYFQPAPVLDGLDLANIASFGMAAKQLGLSGKQFIKSIMSAHHLMLYDFILQTLPTFKLVPDWTDASTIPEWIVEGNSSD